MIFTSFLDEQLDAFRMAWLGASNIVKIRGQTKWQTSKVRQLGVTVEEVNEK